MSETPYDFFLGTDLAMRERDGHGEHYTDRLRRSALEAATLANPADLAAGTQLFELYLRSKDYRAALNLAATLYDASADDAWIVKQLRCLLFLQDFEGAAALHDAHQHERRKPLIRDSDAIQFMRDTIFSDNFLDMEAPDYEKLFYLKPLMRRLGPHLRVLSYSLMDRFFVELLVLAKDYVDRSGASFHYMSCSDLLGVHNKSASEIDLIAGIARAVQERRKLKWLQSNPPHMADIHRSLPQYNTDYIAQLHPGLKNVVQATRLMIGDWESEHFNIRGGQRVTIGQPESFQHTVHCIGESETFGYGTEDALTFCSVLQARLNAEHPGQYRVENYGFPGGSLPFSVSNLLQTKIFEGDSVVFFGFPQLGEDVAKRLGISASHISFSRPHAHGDVFVDDNHFGWTGHKVVADALYDQLIVDSEHAAPQAPDSDPDALEAARRCIQFVKYLLFRRTYLAIEESSMGEYLNYLEHERVSEAGLIGSVAVNCNPMTNGHLHLLEHAAYSCDFLYVFVIEQDTSYFSFAERYEGVTKGLAHLPNVKVLKGGRYICTDLTVPEYSLKAEKSDSIADMSMEAWSFAEFIAKRLNITRIFLGREPTCQITQQYNTQMELILPRFGIEVEIIDRIEHGGAPISASLVRELLTQQRFDLIREIVPPTTYENLLRHHGGDTAAQ